jgi:hypothetical protein
MSEETNTPQEEKELSPEQYKAMKDNQHKHYKEQLPFLKTTLEYERLIADIEEARLKYYTMRMRIAQLLAPPMPEPEPEEPTEETPKKERKLKTQG